MNSDRRLSYPRNIRDPFVHTLAVLTDGHVQHSRGAVQRLMTIVHRNRFSCLCHTNENDDEEEDGRSGGMTAEHRFSSIFILSSIIYRSRCTYRTTDLHTSPHRTKRSLRTHSSHKERDVSIYCRCILYDALLRALYSYRGRARRGDVRRLHGERRNRRRLPLSMGGESLYYGVRDCSNRLLDRAMSNCGRAQHKSYRTDISRS